MYTIKKTAYKILIRKFIHEDCGVIAGNNKFLEKVYSVENKAKKENMFTIGFIDKIKILIDMVKNKFFDYVPFHVHNKGFSMSLTDVKYAKIGSINAVICKRKLGLFKVIKTRNGKNCIPIIYKKL